MYTFELIKIQELWQEYWLYLICVLYYSTYTVNDVLYHIYRIHSDWSLKFCLFYIYKSTVKLYNLYCHASYGSSSICVETRVSERLAAAVLFLQGIELRSNRWEGMYLLTVVSCQVQDYTWFSSLHMDTTSPFLWINSQYTCTVPPNQCCSWK